MYNAMHEEMKAITAYHQIVGTNLAWIFADRYRSPGVYPRLTKVTHNDTPITEDDELVVGEISMELEDFDQYVHAKPGPLPLKIFLRSSKVVCVSYVLGIGSVDEQSSTCPGKACEG
jgi:hypothetical protein